jgi:hypothetical protein
MPNDAPIGGDLVRRERGALSKRSAALIDRGLRDLEAIQSGFAEAVLSRASLLHLIASVAWFLPDDPDSLEVDEESDFAEIEIADGCVAMRAHPAMFFAVEMRIEAKVLREGRVSLAIREIYDLRGGVVSLPDGLVTLTAMYLAPMASSSPSDDPNMRLRTGEDERLRKKLRADHRAAEQETDRKIRMNRRMGNLNEYWMALGRSRNATLRLRAGEISYTIKVSTRRRKWARGEMKTWSMRGRDLTQLVRSTAHAAARPPDPNSGSVLSCLLFDLGPERLRVTGANSYILARAHAPALGGSEVATVLNPKSLLKFVALLGPDETVTISTCDDYRMWFTGGRARVKIMTELPPPTYPSYDAKFPTDVWHEAVADRLTLVATVREAAAGGTGCVKLMIEDGEAAVSEWSSDYGIPSDENALVFDPDSLLSQLEHAGGDRISVQICLAPPGVPGGGRMCVIRSSDPVQWVGLLMPLVARATPSKPTEGPSPVRSDLESYPPISRDLLDQWAKLVQEQKRLGLFRPAKQPPVDTELGEEDLLEGP